MEKKLLSILLVLAMCLTLLPGVPVVINAADASDTPTETDLAAMTTMSAWAEGGYDASVTELTINNADDFKAFQIALCTYGKTFDGYTVYLTADLDMNPNWNSPVYLEWDSEGALTENADQGDTTSDYDSVKYVLPGIGSETNNTSQTKTFNGVFDGMGHSISGLATKPGALNSGNAASLFGQTTGTATVVKNLTVLDSVIVNGKTSSAATSQVGVKPVAGLFTIVPAGASATISNCYIDIDLYDAQTTTKASDSKAGGLVGYCQGDLTVENCVYAGSISNNTATTTDGSTATAAKRRMGGAVGRVEGTSSAQSAVTMTNFVFTGKIYNQDPGASGCIGYCAYGDVTLTNCLSLGKLYGSSHVAGFISALNHQVTENITLTDCYYNGDATVNWVGNTTHGAVVVTQIQNGSSYVESYAAGASTTKTTTGEAGTYTLSEVTENTLTTAIGGDGSTLASVYNYMDGTLVPTALNTTFGDDTHTYLGVSVTEWAASGYAALTTPVLWIRTPADFKAFQDAMCVYGKTLDGYTVYLLNDLTFNSTWTSPVHLDWGWSYLTDGYGTLSSDSVQYVTDAPDSSANDYYELPAIDTSLNENSDKKEFNGTFEGNGHSVSGLYISGNYGTCVAVFGQVTKTAVVKDLILLNSYFDNPYSSAASSTVKPIGGLFSIVNDGATASISNCYVDVDLYDGKVPAKTATDGQTGGLVGYCCGTLNVTDTVYAGNASYNFLDTTEKGKRNLGGAVGLADGAAITMENFVFAGSLYNQWQRVSGGIGRLQGDSTVTMTRCLNLGRIYTGNGDRGGLIGNVLTDGNTTVTLNDCYTLTNDNAYLMIGVGVATENTSFKASIYTNGEEVGSLSDTTSTAQQKIAVGNCKMFLNKNSRLYSFVSGENYALNEAPYGGVEGQYLSDQFVIVGGVLCPTNLYNSILSARIPDALTSKSYTISLQGNIWFNLYSVFADTDYNGFNLNANSGLLSWIGAPENGEYDYGTEDGLTAGLLWNGGKYGQHTVGIAAPLYGQTVYMRPYFEVNGEYTYGNVAGYSVQKYCVDEISYALAEYETATTAGDTDAAQKAYARAKLCVAILNYGAAAQKVFDPTGEKYGDLVNGDLDESLITAFDATMIDAVVELGDTVSTSLEHGTAGAIISGESRSISLEEGVYINYYFRPVAGLDTTTIKTAQLLTWSGETELTLSNATKTDLVIGDDGRYAASGDMIAAPEWGDTIYACAMFTDVDGNTYYTTIRPYSAHAYAEYQINNSADANLVGVCQQLIVYSYLAEQYFG